MVIEVNNVSKTYKKNSIKVLNKVNITIPDKEIVVLLGHNGSGKSTLLKCMTGVIKPTDGEVLVDGENVFKKRNKIIKRMGVVFNQKPSFIVDLSVMNNLLFFKTIYDISHKDFDDMLNMIDGYLHIRSLYDKQYRKLSFGERVKCEIASVMLHKPKYLFLDEPTIGLDYNAKKSLYQLLKFYNDTFHTTIIIITHEVDYVQYICDHALIISKGTICYNNALDNITKAVKKEGFLLHISYLDVKDQNKANDIMDKAFEVNEAEHKLGFKIKNQEMIDAVLIEALEAFFVEETKVENISLREVLENVLKESHCTS